MTSEEMYNKFVKHLELILAKDAPTAAELSLVAKHLHAHKIEPPAGGTEADKRVAEQAAARALPFGADPRDGV